MPVYEYKCARCRHHYEKREGFDAPSLQSCPVCGADARRVLHAAPIVFKGSGFYSTDNRSSKSTAADSPSSAGSVSSDSDKGEDTASKPSPESKDSPAVAAG